MGGVSFGQENFGQAKLGDSRRTDRLVELADRFLAHPNGTLPEKCADPAMYQGLLGLLNVEAVTHRSVLQPHLDLTRRRMAEYPDDDILLIGDITPLDFTSRKSLRGQVGIIGDGRGRGYECFNLLAVVAGSKEVLGLANQVLFKAKKAPKNQSKAANRKRTDRQSRLWQRCHQDLPPAPEGRRWVYVYDREGDTTEALDAMHQANKSYVIRSHSNRCVIVGHDDGGPKAKLHDHLRGLQPVSQRTVEVQTQNGQPGRQAVCGVAWAAVQILPPRQARGEHGTEPLVVWALRVWELNPPEGAQPLEWLLLTNVAINEDDDAHERVDWYETRWVVEEYHKAQKTGCDIEKAQLKKAERLEPLLALLSVVAVALLRLRDASRDPERAKEPATVLFAEILVLVLSVWRYREARPEMTVGEFFTALARMGGHQNRKGDGEPGWLVLWRGWRELQAMVNGALCLQRALGAAAPPLPAPPQPHP
jgi:hypothetical protein